MGMINY